MKEDPDLMHPIDAMGTMLNLDAYQSGMDMALLGGALLVGSLDDLAVPWPTEIDPTEYPGPALTNAAGGVTWAAKKLDYVLVLYGLDRMAKLVQAYVDENHIRGPDRERHETLLRWALAFFDLWFDFGKVDTTLRPHLSGIVAARRRVCGLLGCDARGVLMSREHVHTYREPPKKAGQVR